MSEPRGVYGKYLIRKITDGSLVENAFVLRPDRDEHACRAILAYAESVKESDPALQSDLVHWVLVELDYSGPPPPSEDLGNLGENEIINICLFRLKSYLGKLDSGYSVDVGVVSGVLLRQREELAAACQQLERWQAELATSRQMSALWKRLAKGYRGMYFGLIETAKKGW